MNYSYEGVHLFDIPSLVPDFNLKKINEKIKYIGFVFNSIQSSIEKKIFDLAKKIGYACFTFENLNSNQICANLAYNLNQIGEFVCIWTNDPLLFQVAGPRINIFFQRENDLYDFKKIEEKFGIEPWKLPDLFSFIGFEEKKAGGVIGIEKEKVLKWLKFFSSAEEMVFRLDLLELVEDEKTFHYQNLIKKQEEKILNNLRLLKLEPNFLISIKKENFSIKKKAKVI
jgi:5'-3' exonuclease